MAQRPKKQRPAVVAAAPGTSNPVLLRLRTPWPRWLRGACGVLLLAGLLFVAWLNWWPSAPAVVDDAFPIPAYTETSFLNTGRDAPFAGIDACAECHAGKHDSYLLTAHSRAFADVDPPSEPPDGFFFHERSGSWFRVYRRDGQLRHEETLRAADGKEIARVDLPVRYRVGSGDFAHTYLVEVEGFLHESPITWYAAKKQWGMSPGYDRPTNMGFERPVTASCVVCHVGRVGLTTAVEKPRLVEKRIGCESCHGPGAQHVAARKAKKLAPGEDDLTIVNPAKLARPRLEAVCASCHLNSAAAVYLRGRQVADFRPGMPLSDYRIDYRLDSGSEHMTVVGHMEQLRQSVCYQKSRDMSCLTCHNPHARAKPQDAVALYRKKCLECHADHGCKLDLAQRLKQEPADNCAACHMPRGDTEVPHVAFTHHRIGLHTAKPAPASQRIPELIALDDCAALTPLDRKRNLGLAYLQAAHKDEYAAYAGAFTHRARKLLEEVHDGGLRDADTLAALAGIYFHSQPALSKERARQALQAKDVSAEVRASALTLLATLETKEQSFEPAIGLLKELVLLRYTSEDWGLLGICQLSQQQPREAILALEHALVLRPDREVLHMTLAKAYQQLGDNGHAREHEEKAQWFSQNRKK